MEQIKLKLLNNISGNYSIVRIIFNEIITSCVNMLNGVKASEIDLSKFNSSRITNMTRMFYGCKNLTSINLSNFQAHNVKNMVYLFFCENLLSLNLSNFRTSKVMNMTYMFYGCYNLTFLNLSDSNTS